MEYLKSSFINALNQQFRIQKRSYIIRMRGGIIKGLLKGLHEAAAAQPDTRGANNSRKYNIADFIPSAFTVAYGQPPSILHLQWEMERK
jgi:hypothetical protein